MTIGDIDMTLDEAAVEYGAEQKPEELRLFRGLFAENEIKSILEIGSYNGGMLWWFKRVFPKAKVVSIDPKFQVHADVSIVGLSFVPEAYRAARDNGPYDLLFIDGDHSYEGVSFDYYAYKQFARFTALHDIVEHLDLPSGIVCDVHTLWNEITPAHKIELIAKQDTRSWAGIGVTW